MGRDKLRPVFIVPTANEGESRTVSTFAPSEFYSARASPRVLLTSYAGIFLPSSGGPDKRKSNQFTTGTPSRLASGSLPGAVMRSGRYRGYRRQNSNSPHGIKRIRFRIQSESQASGDAVECFVSHLSVVSHEDSGESFRLPLRADNHRPARLLL